MDRLLDSKNDITLSGLQRGRGYRREKEKLPRRRNRIEWKVWQRFNFQKRTINPTWIRIMQPRWNAGKRLSVSSKRVASSTHMETEFEPACPRTCRKTAIAISAAS